MNIEIGDALDAQTALRKLAREVVGIAVKASKRNDREGAKECLRIAKQYGSTAQRIRHGIEAEYAEMYQHPCGWFHTARQVR